LSIQDYLVCDLELKGKSLKDMQLLVKTEEDLEDLKNFIILNEGRIKSNIHLVYLYTMRQQEKRTVSQEHFVSEYQQGNKMKAVESVVKSSLNTVLLNKVENILRSGLTLENLYDKLVEYKALNVVQALRLIELHINSLKKIS
jgi:hypothetical protein